MVRKALRIGAASGPEGESASRRQGIVIEAGGLCHRHLPAGITHQPGRQRTSMRGGGVPGGAAGAGVHSGVVGAIDLPIWGYQP